MTRARLLRHGITPFDVVLILGVAMVPVLAWRGLRLVELGALPLLLAPFLWRQAAPDRNDLLTIALFGQYALLVTLNMVAYPVPPGASGEVEGKVVLYLGSALLLALMVVRLRLAAEVGRIWRVVGPAAVLLSVALLGWDHVTSPPPENCRVGYLSKHLLIPPLWLTAFAVASYHGWARQLPWERWIRHLALALVILATVAFSGARAMLVAQAVTIPMLALLLGRGEAVLRRLRIVAVLGAVSVAGFLGGLALDIRAGCQFAHRLVAIVQTFDRSGEAEELTLRTFADKFEEVEAQSSSSEEAGEAAPAAPPAPALDEAEFLVGAVYIRPVLWRQALERIGEAPLLGHGHLNEATLVTGDFPHFHQQYLSWLVWGGPVMLVSGLVMLFAPLATFGVRRSMDGAILALAMIAPLGVSFLAATNLLHTVMLLGYAVTLALLHALAREGQRAGPAAAGERDGVTAGRFRYTGGE